MPVVTIPEVHFEFVQSFGGQQFWPMFWTFVFLAGSIFAPGLMTHFMYKAFDWVETASVKFVARVIDLLLPGDQKALGDTIDAYVDKVAAILAKPVLYVLSHVIGSTILEFLALGNFVVLILNLFSLYVTGSFSFTIPGLER